MNMTPLNGSNKIVVVGGGAAGMMAALQAAWAGADVLLLEKNGWMLLCRVQGKLLHWLFCQCILLVERRIIQKRYIVVVIS